MIVIGQNSPGPLRGPGACMSGSQVPSAIMPAKSFDPCTRNQSHKFPQHQIRLRTGFEIPYWRSEILTFFAILVDTNTHLLPQRRVIE
jgi:hypothetical protein